MDINKTRNYTVNKEQSTALLMWARRIEIDSRNTEEIGFSVEFASLIDSFRDRKNQSQEQSDDEKFISSLVDSLAESLKRAKKLLEKYTGLRPGIGHIPTIKPSHGSCCTCQECGHDYDECCCEHNAIYSEAVTFDAILEEYRKFKEGKWHNVQDAP